MAESDPTDEHRRRLTAAERHTLLERPLAGVFSTLSEGGWIHSVPVFYRWAGGDIRILAGAAAVKTRNAERTGQATFCVETIDGPVRSYVTVAGPVTVLRPPPWPDLVALDERYGRADFAGGWDDEALAAAVLLVLRPERWIAWADWD